MPSPVRNEPPALAPYHCRVFLARGIRMERAFKLSMIAALALFALFILHAWAVP